MRILEAPWLVMEEAVSTQDVASSLLESPDCPSVVFTEHQLQGRGRFRRNWQSERGDSLTFSLVLHAYKTHRKPWLIGMATAVAVAQTLGGNVQWPNDVLLSGKKVAGILIELLPVAAAEKTPVVGIGVNVNQAEFPDEITDRATSLFIETGLHREPVALAQDIVESVIALPEPDEWAMIQPLWIPLDATPGKRYKLASGATATATGIGEEGELVCESGGEQHRVMAAEAIFGHAR